eukprot:400900_1
MTTTQSKADLNMFEYDIDDKCDTESDDPFEECNVVKRLICGLQYYSSLNVVNEKNDQNKFSQFICNVYHRFLDDYSHLINIHGHKLEDINKMLLLSDKFDVCDIKKCIFTSRHENTNNSNDNDSESDSVLNFYTTTMDSLHFYLFHLFDVGLRVKSNPNDIDIKDENDNNVKCFDKEFSRIISMINERKHITAAFNRFNTNDKFNINVKQQNSDSSMTYLDEMYE